MVISAYWLKDELTNQTDHCDNKIIALTVLNHLKVILTHKKHCLQCLCIDHFFKQYFKITFGLSLKQMKVF